MRIEERMVIGVKAKLFAYTGAPHCASKRFMPTVRKKVDLPDMFEPVTSSSLSFFPTQRSLTTGIFNRMSGWAIPVVFMKGEPSSAVG